MSRNRIGGDHAALLAALADRPRGRRRVEIDPEPYGSEEAAYGHVAALGTVDEGYPGDLDGRAVRVYGPPIRSFREGADFTRTWRVATDRGTFDVAYSVDRTPENRTHTVYVRRVGDSDGEEEGEDR